MKKNPAVNIDVAKKVLKVVKQGLTCGLGDPEPGKMCVEAAVCYAMGMEHSDEPICVRGDVNRFKICLNDNTDWSSDKARGNGLKEIAIAQLGSNKCKTKTSFIDIANKIGVTWAANYLLQKDRIEDFADIFGDICYDSEESCVNGLYNLGRNLFDSKSEVASRWVAFIGVEALREMKSPGIKYMEKLLPATKARKFKG